MIHTSPGAQADPEVQHGLALCTSDHRETSVQEQESMEIHGLSEDTDGPNSNESGPSILSAISVRIAANQWA